MSDAQEAKDKADALGALCEGSFKRRNELEAFKWKLNFSLWTGVVLAAWAFHSKADHLGFKSLFFGLVIPLHAYIIRTFNTSIQQAVSFAMIYLHELEKFVGIEQPLSQVVRRTRMLPWYVVEVGPTVFLVVAAITLVW